jgi:hypothetical protein
MLTDPDYGVHYSRTPPEELLVFSILSRAILDLFGSVGLASNSEEVAQAKQDALSFLAQKTGGWAKRRNELCEAVGIDGDDMRNRVVRVLEGDMMALDTYETRGALTHVADARELWKNEKGATARARVAAIQAKQRRESIPARNSITKYSEVRPIILKLLDQPRSFKDLIIATNGDVSDSTIRNVLRIGIEKGEVIKPESSTYVLASAPQTAVAVVTG